MAELAPRFHWLVPTPSAISQDTIADARRRGLSPRLIRVLTRRASVDGGALAARFDAPETSLHDPRSLPDAGAALGRVRRAVEHAERVLVFGDFDADGLTGLAILCLALRRLGLDAAPYVPSRVEEGHGLSLGAIERAVGEGRTLIMTADTGSTSVAEVAAARAAGVDVIVTDHHALPPALPDTVALVNPHRADSVYPDRRLSGSGVAFKVAQLLLADEPGGPDAALALADLAAIGAIADVVPLEGENRAITRLGLRRLADAPRPGLAALLAAAGLAPERIDRDAVSFRLAPRINALGRIGHAGAAAELLLTDDPATIERLAAELEAANDLRKELLTTTLAEARAVLAADPEKGSGTGAEAERSAMLVLAGPWPVGIIGLVAGRLAEELGRPTLVVSTAVTPWRGSARSAGGFDLAAAFRACDHLLERHGGHPAAAGCHVAPEQFETLRSALGALAPDAAPTLDQKPSLLLDLVSSAGSVDHVLLRELAPLEGAGDEPALLGIAGLEVLRVRLAGGGHTQLTLRKGKDVVDAISFGRPDLAELVIPGTVVDVAARLTSRTFAGLDTLQLEVRDVAPAGHLAAMRATATGALVPVTDGTPALAGR